jgi:[acyl-carrier-protein] S-malonyltransferase
MASSSLAIPSVSLKTLSFTSSDAFNKGIRGFALKNGNPSRVFMSLSVGSQTQTVVVDDTLFLDYKPTSAFLFPGQVSLLLISFTFLILPALVNS